MRIISELRPKAFILENVRGLFRPAFKPYLDYVTLQLTYPHVPQKTDEAWRSHLLRLRQHDKGRGKPLYRVLSQAINAADYGAAQKRHRAIFIGVASNYGDEWAFPKTTHSQEALTWSKHMVRDYWDRHNVRPICEPTSELEAQVLKHLRSLKMRPRHKPWVTVRDVVGDLPAATKSEQFSGHWQHPGARAYTNPHGQLYGRARQGAQSWRPWRAGWRKYGREQARKCSILYRSGNGPSARFPGQFHRRRKLEGSDPPAWQRGTDLHRRIHG